MSVFEDYIDYIKDNPKGYWFRARWFGWGWTPARWQGWVVVFMYIVLLLIIGINSETATYSDTDAFYNITIPVGIITAILVAICIWKGEKPYWNWGGKKRNK